MISRRAFVAACAAVPLLPLPIISEPQPAFKFGLRCGLIWCRGRQLQNGKWHLAIGLYEKRWRSDGEVQFRHLNPPRRSFNCFVAVASILSGQDDSRF